MVILFILRDFLLFYHCSFIIAFHSHFGDVINILIPLMLLNVSILLFPVLGLLPPGSYSGVFFFVFNVLFGVFFFCVRDFLAITGDL